MQIAPYRLLSSMSFHNHIVFLSHETSIGGGLCHAEGWGGLVLRKFMV